MLDSIGYSAYNHIREPGKCYNDVTTRNISPGLVPPISPTAHGDIQTVRGADSSISPLPQGSIRSDAPLFHVNMLRHMQVRYLKIPMNEYTSTHVRHGESAKNKQEIRR
jgi:hypothetical protein